MPVCMCLCAPPSSFTTPFLHLGNTSAVVSATFVNHNTPFISYQYSGSVALTISAGLNVSAGAVGYRSDAGKR
eukprot:14736997-Alexandrium_andersonii.AAC.1